MQSVIYGRMAVLCSRQQKQKLAYLNKEKSLILLYLEKMKSDFGKFWKVLSGKYKVIVKSWILFCRDKRSIMLKRWVINYGSTGVVSIADVT